MRPSLVARKFISLAAAFTASTAALISIIYGFNVYVDSRVEHAMHDEAFLHKVASHVRPSLIFDQKRAVLVDSGALEYIAEIKPTVTEKDFALPGKILVRPKQYLAHAPILSTLDNYVLDYTVDRTTGLDWEFTIKNYMGTGLDNQFKTCRYRLEILY
jgi:hypothetical protein